MANVSPSVHLDSSELVPIRMAEFVWLVILAVSRALMELPQDVRLAPPISSFPIMNA
jgi:hypothetical protein